jgi:hypothetical protein
LEKARGIFGDAGSQAVGLECHWRSPASAAAPALRFAVESATRHLDSGSKVAIIPCPNGFKS